MCRIPYTIERKKRDLTTTCAHATMTLALVLLSGCLSPDVFACLGLGGGGRVRHETTHCRDNSYLHKGATGIIMRIIPILYLRVHHVPILTLGCSYTLKCSLVFPILQVELRPGKVR